MTDEQKRLASNAELDERISRYNDDTPGERLVHTGSHNITGYKPQTEEAMGLVNDVKGLERQVASFLQERYFRAGVPLDPRQVASARTHLEYAFYHLVRAVFQPADPIGDVVKAGPR